MWVYAVRHHLTGPDLTRIETRREIQVGLITTTVFLISIGIAALNANLAMYFWSILFLVTLVTRLEK